MGCTGFNANCTDPTTWVSFEEAYAAAQHDPLKGIGFVFDGVCGLTGVDFDDCVNLTAQTQLRGMRPTEYRYLTELSSYAEFSPSGTGFKVIFEGTIPEEVSRRGFGKGNGIYDSGRFFTITGDVVPGYGEIHAVNPGKLSALLNEWFPPKAAATRRTPLTGEAVAQRSPRMTDEEVLSAVRQAKNREKFCTLFDAGDWESLQKDDGTPLYPSQSEADYGLCSLLSFYTQDPDQLDRLFRLSALMGEKWAERDDYGERTIESVLSAREMEECYGESKMAGTATIAEARPSDSFALQLVNMADVEAREVDWLWRNHLAQGMVHILGGYAGDGKSTLTTALAATLSTGGMWPDGTRAPQGKTLFLLAEDAPDTSLKPRLHNHGARHDQISVIESVKDTRGKEHFFDLGKHLAALEAAIVQHGIRLLVIDPLSSFMTGTRRNDEGEVRDLLQPLVKLAQRTGVAVLGVMHTGKPNGQQRRAAQQLLGSTGFVGLARVVMMVAPLTRDAADTRRVLAVVKSNVGPKPGREFDIARETVTWGEEYHGLFEDLPNTTAGGTPGKGASAETFVLDFLASRGGAVPSQELQAAAVAAGHSDATVRRACEQLGTRRWKGSGNAAPWYIGLPESQPQEEETSGKLFIPLDTTMNNLVSSDWEGIKQTCSRLQDEQVTPYPVVPQVVHGGLGVNNLSFLHPNQEKGDLAS